MNEFFIISKPKNHQSNSLKPKQPIERKLYIE
jgi:hypothetical protein